MTDLKCKLKEDKPLFGSFKLISGSEAPRVSDPTYTQKGRFKKEKGQTVAKWESEADIKDNPCIM